MKCMACKDGYLVANYLEDSFYCHTCESCNGNMVMLSDYMIWHEQHNKTRPVIDQAREAQADTVIIDESTSAMICPKSGKLMTKYRISSETEHRLDFCSSSNVFWMDNGEWDLLKKLGLAGKLKEIFTQYWQREIKSIERTDLLKELYEERFGDNYERIKSFRKSFNKMPNKSAVMAYLMADDPYRP